jgi:hypothetical protein
MTISLPVPSRQADLERERLVKLAVWIERSARRSSTDSHELLEIQK